jgi:hypothetical protein
LSKPDNWAVRGKELYNHTASGYASTYTALKELKEYGYIKQILFHDNDGKIIGNETYITEFTESVNVDNLGSKEPRTRIIVSQRNRTVINTDQPNTDLKILTHKGRKWVRN